MGETGDIVDRRGGSSWKARLASLWASIWGFRAARLAIKAAAITAAVTFLMPNEYTSEAVILPSDANAGGLTGLSLAAAAIGFNFQGLQNTPDQTFETILESRWLGEGLLTHTYEFRVSPFRFAPAKPQKMTLLEYLGEPNVDKGMKALPKILSIDRNLKTSVVTIDTSTRSPELSQQVTALAVQLLEEFLTDHNQTTGHEKARFASERLKDAEKGVDEAEGRLRDFLRINRNYQQSDDPDVRLGGQRLEADLQLRRQVLTTLSMNREQALLDEKNDTPILNVLERGNLPIEKSRPHRALWAALAAALAFLWVWAHDRKDWLMDLLREEAS